jgi:pyruvate,water dikinase
MNNYLSLRREVPKDINNFDGVGLLKGEYSDMTEFATSDKELANTKKYLQTICALLYPKPVWYRTNDISTEFANKLKGTIEYDEANRHFGLRGIRRSLVKTDEFSKEMKMLEDVRKKYDNLNIFFPMVNDVMQYNQAKNLARKYGYTGRIGIMAETVACVLTLNDFISEGVDYVVFGLNDLTDGVDSISRKNTSTNPLIYRDKKLRAVKIILKQVNWAANVEYVLSGDFGSETIEILKEFKFNAVAIPYYLYKNNTFYEKTIKALR